MSWKKSKYGTTIQWNKEIYYLDPYDMEANPKLGELRQGRNNKNTRLEERKHMEFNY